MTTQQYDDPDPFAQAEKSPALSFPTVGTTYTGIVTEPPKLVQQTVYNPKRDAPKVLATWPDGNPKMAVVINLTVDGEPHSLWAPKPSAMFRALADAQKQAGSRILPGGTLAVKFTSEQPTDGYPQKLYAVKYTAGAADPFAEQAKPVNEWNTPTSADAGGAPPF